MILVTYYLVDRVTSFNDDFYLNLLLSQEENVAYRTLISVLISNRGKAIDVTHRKEN